MGSQKMTRAEKKAAKKEKRANESFGRKWTRRSFIGAGAVAGLAASGALIVGVSIRPGDRTDDLAKFVTEGDEQLVSSWVKIAPDNTVTAIIPHGEMGQGVHTALSAMLAEEMEADWDAMEIMEAPAEMDFTNFELIREFLLGDKNIPNVLFGVGGMMTAGAAARELLLEAASQQWDVPLAELRAEKSYIYHGDKKAPFAEFAKVAATLTPNMQPKLKKRSDYKLMGKSLPRVDIPAKVDGTAMFGIDAQVEGMKYATVMAAPVHGQTVAKMDASDAKDMPGVIDVYNMTNYVAVIAEGYWQASQALAMVDVTWSKHETNTVNQASIFEQYAKALDTGKKKTLSKAGSVSEAEASAASIYKAEYQVPYLAHACMEPMNATAWVRDGKCDMWAGTQNPLGTRIATAETLGFELENVTLHTHFMGGGFGRRAMLDYTNQAALISAKAGVPIKLIWSREESTQQDHYRPAVLGRFKAALDDEGMPISWESSFVHKLDPPEASDIFYDIPNKSIQMVESPTHIRLGAWRSVDHTQHGFFTESFIDELAANAKMDGYEFRRKLLKTKPRHLKVLDTAAKMANWGKPLPASHAQGISITDSFWTIVAEVVTVDMTSGEPRVVHVACAADAGMAVNPDGFKAQMESGIIYGLTAALYGEISISDGAVEQSNFHDYQPVRMDDAPEIDVEIISSDARIGGAGEPGTPPISPAVANAVFKATGKRIRQLPLSKHDFGAAS